MAAKDKMFGLGTIINVVAIIVGGVMGLLFGKKLTERYQSNLMMASALCVLFIGVSGCMAVSYTHLTLPTT